MYGEHQRGGAEHEVVTVAALRSAQGQLGERHHQRSADDRGGESRYYRVAPHGEDDQYVFDQVSAAKQHDPSEQQVGDHQYETHVQARYRKDMCNTGHRIVVAQFRVDPPAFPGHQCGDEVAVGFA